MNQNRHSDSLILIHHGIKGQKWGERRFQNEDGTLTPAGKERYGIDDRSSQQSHGSNSSAKPSPTLPSKKSSNIFEKMINGIGSSLGFDARAEYKNAQDYANYIDSNSGSYSGSTANMYRDEIERLSEILENGELTDEQRKRLEEAIEYMELHVQKVEEYREKADKLAKQYESTPVGSIETTFNKAVDAGEKWINQAASDVGDFASDVGDFLGNIFGKK